MNQNFLRYVESDFLHCQWIRDSNSSSIIKNDREAFLWFDFVNNTIHMHILNACKKKKHNCLTNILNPNHRRVYPEWKCENIIILGVASQFEWKKSGLRLASSTKRGDFCSIISSDSMVKLIIKHLLDLRNWIDFVFYRNAIISYFWINHFD